MIAFTGLKGSGKSEACKYIESIHPDAVRINFKDAMIGEMRQNLHDTLVEIGKVYEMSVDELFKNKPPIEVDHTIHTEKGNFEDFHRQLDNLLLDYDII